MFAEDKKAKEKKKNARLGASCDSQAAKGSIGKATLML